MNDKDIRIAVYYIATGDYKKLFPEFLESVQNFFPPYKKVVKVISDGLEEFKDYEKGNVKVDLCPRINDYPWPIITLYKMWHILENFDEGFDYYCYFNGNAEIHEHDLNVFDMNKITVSYHSFNSKNCSYNPWEYININQNSSAYLKNGTYEYIQGGFFFGPKELFRKLCTEVVDLVKRDTCRYIFAQWHDESYLNKWCVLNPTIVDKKYVFTVYKDELDSTRFVYLRNKNEAGVKRK